MATRKARAKKKVLEPSSFEGKEQQRLTVARSYLSDGKVLIYVPGDRAVKVFGSRASAAEFFRAVARAIEFDP
jgi:hypothetical protein